MARQLDEFRDRLDILLKDASGNLIQPDKDTAIGDAVGQYSKDRPRTVVADIAGAGSYDLELPVEWEEGFSEVKQVSSRLPRMSAIHRSSKPTVGKFISTRMARCFGCWKTLWRSARRCG